MCSLCVTPALGVAGDEWRPVDSAELTLKTGVVEKDADAEVLFWEVRIDDGSIEEPGGSGEEVARPVSVVRANDLQRGSTVKTAFNGRRIGR